MITSELLVVRLEAAEELFEQILDAKEELDVAIEEAKHRNDGFLDVGDYDDINNAILKLKKLMREWDE